jgi:antagonist of KipI
MLLARIAQNNNQRSFSSVQDDDAMNAVVTRAGFLTSVQDLGRTGLRRFGVSNSGALDLFALRVANLLVGNNEDAAGLEITLGGLQLQFQDDRIVAWCGGEFDVQIGSRALAAGHAAHLRTGDELKIGRAQIGCRCWLAISGGIDVPLVLGSRSTDLRANFGGVYGRALRDRDRLSLGESARSQTAATVAISAWAGPHDWVSPAKRYPALRFIRGVDWNRFSDASIQHFTQHKFVVSADSDRMGVRLDGQELKRDDEGDLISEAVAPGTIQVPPLGKPILLLGDCQTIGGYPKMAHVITVDFGVAAQLRAGDDVRFFEVSLQDANRLLMERQRDLERFRVGLSLQRP